MIKILDKYNCCGCAACVQLCPKQCISFDEDMHGFRYPLVNEENCIECGICEKVCPVINQFEPRRPLDVYAAVNSNDEIRLASSSGGIFTMLAEYVLSVGGVVFGARFDENWEVMHDYTETPEALVAYRGSKYVQSRVGNTYVQAKKFLNEGRKVLYTGTSCQIAGLKKFLHREYDNLISVDVVCHGVPSPLVWRTYLDYILKGSQTVNGENETVSSVTDRPKITGISFRDKSTGWKNYRMLIHGKSLTKTDEDLALSSDNGHTEKVLLHEPHEQNLFMQVFLKDLCLRPSCSKCPSKSGRSGSDLTIADYWGIADHHPCLDDDKGTSLILVNSLAGEDILLKLNCNMATTTYEEALMGNPSLERSVSESKFVRIFWNGFNKYGFEYVPRILKRMRAGILARGMNKIKRILKKLLNIK